jgi:hypothetical protein
MDPIPRWHVWRNRLGRVKGVCIVFRAADYGLELHSALSNEDAAAACEDLCKVLNTAPRSTYFGQGLPESEEAST